MQVCLECRVSLQNIYIVFLYFGVYCRRKDDFINEKAIVSYMQIYTYMEIVFNDTKQIAQNAIYTFHIHWAWWRIYKSNVVRAWSLYPHQLQFMININTVQMRQYNVYG